MNKIKFDYTNLKILEIPHLGLQSLNRNKKLKKDISGNTLKKGDLNNNSKRIEVIAHALLNNYEKI